MAAVRDKTTGKVVVAGSNGGNASFPTLPSSASTVIVLLSGANASLDYAAGSVTDNQGNTYTQAVQSALNNRGRSAIFYAENIGSPSGTFTITVNTTASTWFGTWAATSFTGMATSALDKTTSSSGTSTTPTSGATAATAQADEVVAGVMQSRFSTPGTITAEVLSPAWVQEYEELDGTNTECGEGDTRIVSASAAMTANWTCDQNQTWTAAIATFKASGGGGGATAAPSQLGQILTWW